MKMEQQNKNNKDDFPLLNIGGLVPNIKLTRTFEFCMQNSCNLGFLEGRQNS